MRRLTGMAYGGDYNPEQWDRDVWDRDVELMREAGVNLVTVGVFSWALLEPRRGAFAFEWLDDVLDLLHDAQIRVDLATATASPPPWLTAAHPEMLPVTADGTTLWPGARQSWCPSSPVFRDHAVRLADALAERYSGHPALVLWHVNNELGCHNAHCHCDVSADAFRRWLRDRYGDLDTLNDVWGTAFWSQRYSDWDQILSPRSAPSFRNPTQQLDFRRFSSDELLDHYRAERDAIRAHDTDTPITTNFMVGWNTKDMDYWSWAREVDVVTNDHYLESANPEDHVELAFSADLTRGLARGEWLLMEHSTSAVNWQPRNRAKHPGELARNSLSHVARGSMGALFFQWRASRAGAEKFHSALVPHAGTATRVWQEVVALGHTLQALDGLRGTRVDADVALVFSWEAWWASELDAHPSSHLRYLDQVHAWYGACWRAGVTVDVVEPGADLDGYAVVLVPGLYLVSDEAAAAVADAVASGASAVVTYFSGIVDEHDHVRLGGYPGAFRELLGAWSEEFHPLGEGEHVALDDGSNASLWTEHLHADTAEVVASYSDGPLPDVPAITRNGHGDGVAWYVATGLDRGAVDRLTRRVLDEAGVNPVVSADGRVEAVRRRADDGATYLVLINHGGEDVEVTVNGRDVVDGTVADGAVTVPGGQVRVIAEH
jgi:beta-galactosidase